MSGESTYSIDELPDEATRLRPAVRLVHLLLRECLQGGFTALRLVAASGEAQAERAGNWKAIMKFPAGVYDAIVAQFKTMAGAAERSGTGEAISLPLSWRGGAVTVSMKVRTAGAERQDLVFTFGKGEATVSNIG